MPSTEDQLSCLDDHVPFLGASPRPKTTVLRFLSSLPLHCAISCLLCPLTLAQASQAPSVGAAAPSPALAGPALSHQGSPSTCLACPSLATGLGHQGIKGWCALKGNSSEPRGWGADTRIHLSRDVTACFEQKIKESSGLGDMLSPFSSPDRLGLMRRTCRHLGMMNLHLLQREFQPETFS